MNSIVQNKPHNTSSHSEFIWHSEVRGYEIDLQGIVNNANYLHYFDHVRIKHLQAKGIDWSEWHIKGYDLVLVHVDMHLKSSLIANDQFYVISKLERLGRIRVVFNQQLYRSDDVLVASAINTTACIDIKTKKPVMPQALKMLLFDQ